MRVCSPPRLLITSGVMWRDIDLMRLVKRVLQLQYGNYGPLSLMGVALELVRVIDNNPLRVS